MGRRRNPNDLIRIEDAIKALCRKTCRPDIYCKEMWDEFEDVERVDAVPARHGKWVDENGNRPYGYRFNWLCSECGRPQHTSTAKLLKEFEEEHRWCHFCGARMDGDHHD